MKRIVEVTADCLQYPRQHTRGERIGRIGCHLQDLTISPTLEMLTRLEVLRKARALVGNGFTYGLHPTFINDVLQEEPRFTVPRPADTPTYQNGEGVDAE